MTNIWLCSNPIGARHAYLIGPRGHCPFCLENGKGNWSTYSCSLLAAPAAPDVAEVVKRLRKHCEMIGHSSSGYETAMHIRNADAAEAALLAKLGQGWVPVRKQLPKDGESVLVWNGKRVREAERAAERELGSYWFNGGRIMGVTHWMPLPPAPGSLR